MISEGGFFQNVELNWGVNEFMEELNRVAQDSPWKFAAAAAAVAATGTFVLLNSLRRTEMNWEAKAKSILLTIPTVKKEYEEGLSALEKELEEKYFKDIDPYDICKTVPEESWTTERILNRLQSVSGTARSGKNSGVYYIDNHELDELIQQVLWLARRTNALHDLNPLVRQLEAEVVKMTASMFHGDNDVVGNLTSGGTDSILHAVYTARERARKEFDLGADWEMIIPSTAHPAFSKAAYQLGIKCIRVEVYPQDHPKAFQVNVQLMREAITSNTILVVGSLPGFPHGAVDPIEKISFMLEEEDHWGKIGLHVDGCLGGFVIPWMKEAGYDLKIKYGFDVRRVTSISADQHKYGYAEKGASAILYRNNKWKRHQAFVENDWPGGIYATPTNAGSRPGNIIAVAWATMVYVGPRYIEETKKLIGKARELIEAIDTDEFLKKYLQIMGKPKCMVVPFNARSPSQINVYDLKKEMSQKGWYLTGLQKPAGIHLNVTAVHGNNNFFVDEFISDLRACVQKVLDYPIENKGKSGDAVLYGTNTQFLGRMFTNSFAKHYWDVNTRVEPVTFKLKK
ncbi:MAG TPA: pyridoxal-dependent decarboxylase [Waddliaceae bacterium]